MKSKPSPTTSERTAAKAPRLRVGLKDVAPAEFAVAVQAHLGKQRVSIMLDGSVIAFFKAKAGERGYQTLINQALHDAMRGEQIADTLRRVIREELRPA
ncbi:MAG: BrnA antitoxin family protein [Rubrivivax sp.]